MHDLHKIIKNFTGESLTTLGELSVDAFKALSGATHWNPRLFMGMEVSKIFDIGLPLALIGNSSNLAEISETLSLHLEGKLKADETAYQSTLAEVHACALLNALGLRTDFVPRSAHRTPDLRIIDDHGQVDVEVARAGVKAQHEDAKKHLRDFAEGLRPGDLDHDILFFFTDVNNPQHRNQAFDAAMSLEAGQVAVHQGYWMVAAIEDDGENSFHEKLSDLQPSWWPETSAAFVVSTVRTGAKPRYVYFKALPPQADYINPLRRKAEKFQGTAGTPFLIALESSNLPNSYEQIEQELDPFWELWDQVSGILLFEPRFWTMGTHKSYIWKLLRNPHSSAPLPVLFPAATKNKQTLDLYVLEAK